VDEEINIAYDARHYGTTTYEMRERLLASEECSKKHVEDYVVCYNAAIWGLSERAYRKRYENAKECRRDIDTKSLAGPPKKERRDHPLVIKLHTCERSVMLRF
jgi:hypothetical protein